MSGLICNTTQLLTSNAASSTVSHDFTVPIGTVLGQDKQGEFAGSDIPVDIPMGRGWHAAIFGKSGMGKSRLLSELVNQLLTALFRGANHTVIVVDPLGLCRTVLALIAKLLPGSQRTKFLPNIHYLSIGDINHVPSFDWFKFKPPPNVPPHRIPSYHAAWLERHVDLVAEEFIREDGFSLNVAARFAKVIKNCLRAAANVRNADGERFPPSEMFTLIDTDDALNKTLLNSIKPQLSRKLASFFSRLQRMKNSPDLVDSTENRFDRVLTVLGRAMFSRTSDAAGETSFDLDTIVQQPSIILLDLAETPSVSRAYANLHGGLFLNRLFNTLRSFPEGSIPYCYLFIDEASRYIADDIGDSLLDIRRWASVWLSTQDVLTLKRGEVDLADRVLSQTSLIATFNQSAGHDLDVLVPRLCRSNFSWKPKVRLQELSDGHEFIKWNKRSQGSSHSSGNTEGTQSGTGEAIRLPSGQSLGEVAIRSDSSQKSSSRQFNNSSTDSETVSEEIITLPKTKLIEYVDGLEMDIPTQEAKFRMLFSELGRAQLVAKIPGVKRAIPVQVKHVADPFATVEFERAIVDQLIEQIIESHRGYFIFEPDLTAEAQDRRLEEWLAVGMPGDDDSDADRDEVKIADGSNGKHRYDGGLRRTNRMSAQGNGKTRLTVPTAFTPPNCPTDF